ncbi:MAG TPA: DUF5302 domain-containing protein [Trebonia sp.]|jgi:hypothetical protein|nr:DUF5302 domain-containing protein [Trebonia sp.]
MTKSAKQDAKGVPAKTAATESAATTDADATESGDDARETAQDAAAVFEGDTHDDDAKPDIDDVKAKFREALDRKRQVHAEGQGKGAHEAGKVNGAHGPAASRRNFRRKSG